MEEIEADNLHEYAEGRVVDDNAVVRVFGVLVVSSWIERTKDALARHVCDGGNVFDHSVVYVLWRIAVVGGLWSIGELGHEGGIVTEDDGVAGAVDVHLADGFGVFFFAEECQLIAHLSFNFSIMFSF